jgi:hypothetical protein
MKRLCCRVLVLFGGAAILSGCERREVYKEAHYLEVIGEYDEVTPEAGYRLTLSYNGPMNMRNIFQAWADSVQKVLPGMVKTNDNIYINYMPEQKEKRPGSELFQVGVTYIVNVTDSATYEQLARDMLKRQIPFSLNMTGTFMEPAKKLALQQKILARALDNAKAKLDYLKGGRPGSTYEIVSIEELDNLQPYGPDYFDFNRRMAARVKVKARLKD